MADAEGGRASAETEDSAVCAAGPAPADEPAASANPVPSPSPVLDLRALVTITLNTSPVPIHPSTRLLEEIVASIFEHAPEVAGCRLIIIADGYKNSTRAQSKWKSGKVREEAVTVYRRYLTRLAYLCGRKGSVLENAELVELTEHHGCAHAFRRSLDLIETKYVLSAQHDRAFIGRADVAGCVRVMEAAEDVNYLGFLSSFTGDYVRRKVVVYPTLREQFRTREVEGATLIPMIQFLDSMHCGRVEWYRQKVFGPNRYTPLSRGCFIEDTLGQVQLRDLLARGMAAHAEYGNFLFDHGSHEKIVYHFDGHDAAAAEASTRKWCAPWTEPPLH